MSENTEIELKERLDATLKEAMVQIQRHSAPSSLVRTKPDKWLYLAAQLSQGRSRSSLFREEGHDHATMRRIEAELAACPNICNLKQELSVQKIQNLQVSHEIRNSLNETLLNRKEEADTMDLLDLGKLIKELSVADKVDMGDLLRMRGDAPHRVEVTNKTVDFETMLKAAKEARDKTKPADVIDIGDDAEEEKS